MNDMRAVIIPKSDQINSDDLIGGPITITVTKIEIRPGTEQPVSIGFKDDNGKPYKPCKSMCRVMVSMWGADANSYIGRSMTLYRDPAVKWGGMDVGGIRISHMTDIAEAHTMALTATKGSRKPFTVNPLVKAPPVADRVADGVRDLIERIQDAADEPALQAVIADAAVIKQRAYLEKNRPDMGKHLQDAIDAALLVYDAAATATDVSPEIGRESD
jgi:hypothetical protein